MVGLGVSAAGMGMDMAPAQRQELLMTQQSSAWSNVFVSALTTSVQEKLANALESERYALLTKSSSGQEHLIYRLTADTLKRNGNKRISEIMECAPEENAERLVQTIYEKAETDADCAVNMWSHNAHVYQASHLMVGEKDYHKWQKTIAQEPELPTDYVPELIRILDQRFKLLTSEIFDRVRTAEFRPMTSSDAPKAVASYMKSLLDSQTLELLVRTPGMTAGEINDNIQKFRAKVNKGVFIWPLCEESLKSDLSGEAKKRTGMELRGRVLEAQNGDWLCWATYLHAPNVPTLKHKATVNRYFKHGVTNAKKMHIEDPEIKEELMENIGRIEVFQDIRSMYPLAADRFSAHLFEEMHVANPNLKGVTAYRLGNVESNPKLDLLREAWLKSLYPAENEKSSKKFREWAFHHIAWDHNKTGPVSVREGIDGIPDGYLELIPHWDVMYGNIHEITKKSREAWHAIQVAHGDLSSDELDVRWSL